MSRSEHGNARDRTDPRDRARKRLIKTLIVAERRSRSAVPEVSGAAIPIEVLDHGSYIHYPASIDDLRGLMARLPEHSLNGVGAIELGLTPVEADADTLDPYVGRLRCEMIAGVYSPPTLGWYDPDGARIRLFAYVYDRATPARPIVELYLRLKMLATFMHELAHHHDYTTRETRGRWRADIPETRELRAEAIEEVWTRSYVVPYVEDTYPAEVAELRRWLVRHGGIAVPLDMLVGPLRRDRPLFDADVAFEQLVSGVLRGEPAVDLKVNFAFQLHYANHFDAALAVLDDVLASEPDHHEALGWRAHVLCHLERFAEAVVVARGLLSRDPDDQDSLYIIGEHAERTADWPGVVEITSRLLHGGERDRSSRGWWALAARARARIELADWIGAERDLGELGAVASSPAHQCRVRALSCLWNLRQRREAAAFAHAIADLEILPFLCDLLRGYGHAEWVGRLEADHPTRAEAET